MIGVIANPTERDVVGEFFQLFKTPWEFYRTNQKYEVLVCADGSSFDVEAKLMVVYAGRAIDCDDRGNFPASQRKASCVLVYQGNRIPIYGDAVTFADSAGSLLNTDDSKECGAHIDEIDGAWRARIGYDLFDEVRTLLTVGQPVANAEIPALELHIAFLRDLITGCGISLVEIPPVPEGFEFVACLTHDVDHPSVRQHKLDHTIVGFLFRATLGSLVDAFLGRMSIRDTIKNWVAAIKLPFVHAGLAKDFWSDFDDRYVELEQGLPSTFFVIPRKNYPGRRMDRSAPALRASRYEAKELADTICKLIAGGREVGLHGIDAWLDSSSGRAELEQIRRLTGVPGTGVRMHWLYYNENSPGTLEKAGAAYDSTVGYNETVGYRAGTTQVYKPLGANSLLELPLHVMDTALFYLSYLGLSPRKARARLCQLADNASRFGGCFTINWHDRSLAPERLWGRCYGELLEELKRRGAWFATAGQAVAWFRKRRAAEFEADVIEPYYSVKVVGEHDDDLPGLRLRVHKARQTDLIGRHSCADYVDMSAMSTPVFALRPGNDGGMSSSSAG